MKRILLSALAFCSALAAAAATPCTDPTAAAPAGQTPPEAAPAETAGDRTPRGTYYRTDEGASGRHFLPTSRRIDREIDKNKFAYKGEVLMGLTASYGTLSSDDTDYMIILDNISADGTVASVKPFIGYFYRDNSCVGVRFGYRHMGGTLDSAGIDLGERNDISMDIPYLNLASNNYSLGVFMRSYAGLDAKGRFGLFAEFELGVSGGSTEFAYESGDEIHRTYSDNMRVNLTFNPGAAVYIFPNVCATLSFGLGGIQYTSVTQRDPDGNKVGSRRSSNMKFKLNIAEINIGLSVHLWDKKKK